MEKASEPQVTYSLKLLGIFVLAFVLAAAAIAFLRALGSAGVVILGAILITYLILPIVQRLQRQMKLVWAILVTYAFIAVVITLVIVLVVPPLVAQAHSLIVSLPPMLDSFQKQLSDPNNPIVAKFPPELRTYLNALPSEINKLVAKYGLGVAQRTLSVLFSVASLFLSVIIVPILSAYLLFDTPEAKRGFLGFIPPKARPKTIAILHDLNHVIGAFVRGQVLDGIILAIMVTFMLWIMKVPYALLIGVAAGFLNLVPYLGAIIGFVPSILLALLANGWENALIVGVLFAVIQQVDGNFILPRIMRENVLLSPLVIIVAILVFSALFGVMGTFLAVPLAAMMRVMKLHFTPAPSEAEMAQEETRARALTVF